MSTHALSCFIYFRVYVDLGKGIYFFSCERTELLIGITNLLWDASWYFMAKQSKNLLSRDKPVIIGSCTTLVFSSQSGHRSSPAQSHGIRSMNLWMEQQFWMDSSMKFDLPMFTIGFWIPQHFDYSKKSATGIERKDLSLLSHIFPVKVTSTWRSSTRMQQVGDPKSEILP